MNEFTYKIGQRTGPAPKIRKLGAIKPGMEQTPVIFKGQAVIIESMMPDDVCDMPLNKFLKTFFGDGTKN